MHYNIQIQNNESNEDDIDKNIEITYNKESRFDEEYTTNKDANDIVSNQHRYG